MDMSYLFIRRRYDGSKASKEFGKPGSRLLLVLCVGKEDRDIWAVAEAGIGLEVGRWLDAASSVGIICLNGCLLQPQQETV